MKQIAIIAGTAGLLATAAMPALAGSLAPAAQEPVVAAPAPVVMAGSDWTGPYVGGALGYGEAFEGDADGMTYGVFGGYDYDFGNFVLGGELEFSASEIEGGGAAIDNVTRLKLRAGYDAGAALIYGVLGGAQANATVGGTEYADTGYLYGLGVDYRISDSFTVGAEVLQHEFDDFDGTGIDVDATTVGLRAAFRF